VGITRNPEPGQDKSQVLPLARKTLDLQAELWYPVRITFKGETATVQVNNTVISATNAILGEEKKALNFLVFGDTAGFKSVKITR
jgi:arylsulfatase A